MDNQFGRMRRDSEESMEGRAQYYEGMMVILSDRTISILEKSVLLLVSQ